MGTGDSSEGGAGREVPADWTFGDPAWPGPVTRQPDLRPQDHFQCGLIEDLFADLHLSWPVHACQDGGIPCGKEHGGLTHVHPASGAHCATLNRVGSEPDGEGAPRLPHSSPPFVVSDSEYWLHFCLCFLICQMGIITVPPLCVLRSK